jgi:para-aminobenzoate synthetase / 4-amino-4-deoxychorismate lyase
VTGAPKIQTMRVIAELEATAREAYTGAIGYASPIAGLELNVAIRTLETRGDRIWLGAGGGIVADSDPEAELAECLLKARPVIEAAGGRLAGEAGRERATREAGRGPVAREPGPRPAVGAWRPSPAGGRPPEGGSLQPVLALDGGASRPDPTRGVFSTLLVREGEAVHLPAHLERLRHSVRQLYGRELPADVETRAVAAARRHDSARLRLTVEGDQVRVEATALPPVASEPVRLAPALLPGGLGAHKWADRRLLDELARRLGAVALVVDLDGHVLEAAHANVWIVEGDEMVTPPLDGRLLPGTVRARLLAEPPAGIAGAREEPITLERLARADDLLLTSSLRDLHRATLAGRAAPRVEAGARRRDRAHAFR